MASQFNIATSVTISAYTKKIRMLEQRKDNAIYKYTIFFSLAMQALVIVLASLIVAFAALSLASNYELFAQRQQTCKDRNTGDYLTSFSCGNV